MRTRIRRLCSVLLIGSLLAPGADMFAPAGARAQGSVVDLTGAWVGGAGSKIAIVQQGTAIRVCTARFTARQFIKVYSGTLPANGAATLMSVPTSIDDIGDDLPPDVREQLIRDFHYSFHIDLRELPRDRVHVAWYIDLVTYSQTTHTVRNVTPSTPPTPEEFSRVSYATPAWWQRGA